MTAQDAVYSIARADILSALTGIVNANLIDGIADGDGTVHPASVVIWENMGGAPKLPGETALSVIVHVDGMSVAPFGGSTVYVNLYHLSHAATFVVVRAERLAAEELDRLEAVKP